MRARVMSRVLVFLLAAAAIACEGDSTHPAVLAPDLPAMEADGVRAALVLEGHVDGVTTLVISMDARALDLGAYQGRLEFDTGRFVLLDAEAPQGADGFRLMNVSAPGTIRFAGFTTEGFTSPVAVRLRLQGPSELRAGDLTLGLEVAGTVEGQMVERSQYQTPGQLYTASSWGAR